MPGIRLMKALRQMLIGSSAEKCSIVCSPVICERAPAHEALRLTYFELDSDIGVTGIDSKPVRRLRFPVASTSLPV